MSKSAKCNEENKREVEGVGSVIAAVNYKKGERLFSVLSGGEVIIVSYIREGEGGWSMERRLRREIWSKCKK